MKLVHHQFSHIDLEDDAITVTKYEHHRSAEVPASALQRSVWSLTGRILDWKAKVSMPFVKLMVGIHMLPKRILCLALKCG